MSENLICQLNLRSIVVQRKYGTLLEPPGVLFDIVYVHVFEYK